MFTSHIQSIRYDLIQYMEGFRASDRQVKLASLPVVDKLEDLKKMDQTKFAGLTYMEATYFSRVPALLWTSRCGDHSLRNTFQRVSDGCEVINFLEPFLAEVLTGTPREKMKLFHSLTDGSREEDGRILWILGYISEFLFHCDYPYRTLADWLESMKKAETKDGKAWEKLVAVAFALRHIRAQMGYPKHGWLHGWEPGTHLQFVEADQAADTVAVMQRLPEPSKYPALQLVLPTHSQLPVVDLMAVRREKAVPKCRIIVVIMCNYQATTADKAAVQLLGAGFHKWLRPLMPLRKKE